MSEDINNEISTLLLTPGEGVQQLGDVNRCLPFPEDKRNHVDYGKINSWLYQIGTSDTHEAIQGLKNAEEKRYRKAGPFYKLDPLPDKEQKVHLLNTMHTFLVPVLSEAISCFNSSPLTENGDIFDIPDYQGHSTVLKATENGVLEAADVILAFYLTYCFDERTLLMKGYPDFFTKVPGILSEYPLQKQELEKVWTGFPLQEIKKGRKLIVEDYDFWDKRIRIITDLRMGMGQFFAGTSAFISHETAGDNMEKYPSVGRKTKSTYKGEGYPWNRLLLRLQGQDEEVQKAFEALGLEKVANTTSVTARQITKAYREALIKAHPDHGGSKEQLDIVEKAYPLALTVSKISE